MAKALQPIQAIVKKIKDPEIFNDRESRSVLCIDREYAGQQGETPRESYRYLRFYPNEYANLPAMDAELTLIPNTNGKGYSILGDYEKAAPPPTAPASTQPESSEPKSLDKKAIAADIDLMTNMFAHTFKTLSAKLPEGTIEETIRCFTTSIMIAVSKKHGLDRAD